ncbi:MAG: hypothetical protein AAF409_20435 [Pseudomonadota bacterium]
MEFRFPYNPVTGQPGTAATPWTNGDPAAGIEGSIPPAEALNDPMREICHVIDRYLGDGNFGSGQDVADLQQLRKAIDAAIAGATDGFVEIAGDTMTGILRLILADPMVELVDTDTDETLRLRVFGGRSRIQVKTDSELALEGFGATDIDRVTVLQGGVRHRVLHKGFIQSMVVQDRQAAGVDGQAIVVNTWQQMPLTAIVKNDITNASIVSNELRLNEPGTYELLGKTVAAGVNRETQIRLRNAVDDSLIEPGFADNAADGADSGGASPEVFGEVTVTAAGQMRVAVDRYSTANQGARLWGRAAAPGVQQVYGQLIARRIA